MEFRTLKQLVEAALFVRDTDSHTDMSYCSKDESLIFVTCGKMYIIPWCKTALEILESNGFCRTVYKNLPYNYEMIPDSKISYWNKLVKETLKEKPA